jgi:FtsZ-binding cell division protein ZapB
MEEMKDRHARDISNIERRHVEDKDRWKKEMAQKIKETKAQMMKLTDNQLEVTTKRTIMENEQMSSELSYQSRQTEKLLEKNRKLLEENGDYRRQVDLYKQTETELAKRNHVYQKTIKTLLGKLKLSVGCLRLTAVGLLLSADGAERMLRGSLRCVELC